MRTLLARASKDEERSIVFLGEEFEGRGVFEGVDLVFLGEFFCEGNAQLVEIAHGILHDLGAGCVAEEEGGFGIFDGLGGFFVECALAARIAGFSNFQSALKVKLIPSFSHLSQHLALVLLVELRNYS